MMKHLFFSLIVALTLGAGSASAFDPKDLLNSLGGKSSDDGNSSSGGVLDALGGIVSNVTANNKFSVDDLVGTWNYTAPAVSFESDNALKKVGGAAAATAVEAKLEPYYTKLGLTATVLEVAADHTFVMKLGKIQLKGSVEKDEENNLVFSFSAFGKISLGKMKAHATKSGSTLNLTFDATKLVQILTKVSSAVNVKTLTTLSQLLSSYEGIY
ncbi:MAG: DUF4923 family protein, partial [Muribaculaceae bacterium]|nr:DUF4923 family protein [Muribaculaceae bacterium]